MEAVPSRGQLGVLILVAVCVIGFAAAPSALAQSSDETEGSFGGQITAFMQSSAADADTTVEQGMWNASIERGTPAGPAVERHTARLQRQLDRLENRTESLQAARQNGSISGVAYTAQASAVRAALRNIRRAINETANTARSHGVDEATLAELREAAGTMEGPEIAAIARTLTDAGPGPPANPGQNGGPPTADGSPGPPTDLPNSGPDGDNTGPPTDRPGNATDGTGADVGNATGGEPPTATGEGGPPTDAGQGKAGGTPSESAGEGDAENGRENSGSGEASSGNSNSGGQDAAGSDEGNENRSDSSDPAGDSSNQGDSAGNSGSSSGGPGSGGPPSGDDASGDAGANDGTDDRPGRGSS